MSLQPWREIIVPHPDVLNGTFQQSEFAADLTAVWTGKATPEYGDAKAFYDRTFITEGMGLLLTQVSQRLNSKGGEPVIQLQTCVWWWQDAHPARGLSSGLAQMPVRRPRWHPGAARSGGADGCAAGTDCGAGWHGPRPRPAVEAWRANDSDTLGLNGMAAWQGGGFCTSAGGRCERNLAG
jgi:hypothetical protein